MSDIYIVQSESTREDRTHSQKTGVQRALIHVFCTLYLIKFLEKNLKNCTVTSSFTSLSFQEAIVSCPCLNVN